MKLNKAGMLIWKISFNKAELSLFIGNTSSFKIIQQFPSFLDESLNPQIN
jgi:hypothetical protein